MYKRMKQYINEMTANNPIAAEFIIKLSTFSFGPIVAAGIGFFSVPIITRMVPPYVYGQLSMSTTAISLIGLFLVLGLDQAYVRNYASSKDVEKIWLTAFIPPLILSAFVAIVVLLFGQQISLLLFEDALIYPIIIFSLTILGTLVERFLLLRVRMREAGGFYSTLNIIKKLGTVVFTIIWVIAFGPRLTSLMLPVLIGSVLVIVTILISPYSLKIADMSFDKSLLKPFLAFGIPLVFASAQMWILNSLDKIALRIWTDFAQMGIYAAAFKLVYPMLIIKSSFSLFWAPVRYRWLEEGVSVKRFQKVADVATVLMIFLFVLLLALRWIVVLLLGPEYREAIHIVPFALVFPLMYTLSETTSIGIGFSGKTIWETISTAVAAVCNVFLNWLLVPRYAAFGAALATAISFFIFFWIRMLVSNRLWLKLNIRLQVLASFTILASISISIFFSDWKADLLMAVCVTIGVGLYMFFRRKNERNATIKDIQ